MASYLPNLDQVKGFTTTAWTQLRQKAGFVVSNMEDFAPLFELNDRVRHEILDQMTEQEIANYDLVPPQVAPKPINQKKLAGGYAGRVCVVGLTSAGKSSLLEGIAKQKIFPVLDGVCTRQPFQLSVIRALSSFQGTDGALFCYSLRKGCFGVKRLQEGESRFGRAHLCLYPAIA
eukprot:558850-Amorphochlora_amoeboformis.AAC.1